MSTRVVRLVVVPALLFAGVAGLTFGLAQSHPAKPEAAAAGGDTPATRGEALFLDRCASCHGVAGRNPPIGPELAGSTISLSEARRQIETGSDDMPPDLVQGRELEDVLAYLETIFAGEPLRED